MARKKGEGRIFVRGGRWYMRWRSNGRECTRCTGIQVDEPNSQKKAEAVLMEATEVLRMRDKASRLQVVKRMLETTEQEIKDRIGGIRRAATLGELDQMFCGSSYRIDCSDAQMSAYRRYIALLCASLGDGVRIADVDAGMAERFARSVAGERSPNTYNKYLNGLGVVWRAVMPMVGSTFNPWEALPRKRLDTSVRRVLTDEEIARVLSTATGELRTLFSIGLYTGLRLGDAVRLKWEDIRDGALYVTTGKTGAKVAIPLHQNLKDAIGARVRKFGPICPSAFDVFAHGRGATIIQRFSRLFKKCGIETSEKRPDGTSRPICGFHSLRHTFVSRCAAAGIDRAVVQALVGHSSARMTEHYTHLSDAEFLAAFSRIA